MPFYDGFLNRVREPVKLWNEQAQALLDEEFDNSSNFVVIGREVEKGSLNFENIEARVMSTLDSKVGDKINDDYRTIFFPDMNYKPVLGERFQFDDNVWLVYNTDNVNSLYTNCYVRRCNNTINSIDYYGRIHREPCVIDIKPTKSSFVENEEMWTISTRQIIMFQKNKWTKDIGFNSRIMFEGQTYRVGVNLNFDRLKTYDKDSILYVRAYLDLDLVNEFDNQEYQIADYVQPIFDFEFLTTRIQGSSSGVFSCQVLRNNIPTEDEVVWKSNDPSILELFPSGEYSSFGQGTVEVTVSLVENPQISKTYIVEISDEEPAEYATIISPEEYYIPLTQTKTYTVFEYLNGEKTDTSFSFSFLI